MPVSTLAELLAERARLHPNRPALIDAVGGPTLTYGELAADAAEGADLLSGSGLRAGDRVAVLADQTVDTWRALHSMFRAGIVPVLVNWRLTIAEMGHIVADSGASAVLASPRHGAAGSAVADTHGVASAPFGSPTDLAGGSPATDRSATGNDDVAVIMYTSGTTTLPKGVRSTHGNLLSLTRALSDELPGFASDATALVAAPLFHIAGFGFGIGPLQVGAPAVLLEQFDPVAVLDAVERHAITHSLLVPAMLQMVVDFPDAERRDTSSLRGVLYGGSPISESLLRTVHRVLGCDLTQAYGLTETTGIATVLRFDDHRRGLAPDADEADVRRLASAGRPLVGTELRISEPDGTGAGEVLVRSDMVMDGYWNRPTETAAAIDDDGWFRTGDIARIVDGDLHIVDRLKDVVITKGENVFPGEVERVLVEHPGVTDVAVVGVPDDDHGEALCAVVQPCGSRPPTLAELQVLCRGRVAGFKVPRRLDVVDELPRTPSGKVQRRLVRERYWSGRDRRVN